MTKWRKFLIQCTVVNLAFFFLKNKNQKFIVDYQKIEGIPERLNKNIIAIYNFIVTYYFKKFTWSIVDFLRCSKFKLWRINCKIFWRSNIMANSILAFTFFWPNSVNILNNHLFYNILWKILVPGRKITFPKYVAFAKGGEGVIRELSDYIVWWMRVYIWKFSSNTQCSLLFKHCIRYLDDEWVYILKFPKNTQCSLFFKHWMNHNESKFSHHSTSPLYDFVLLSRLRSLQWNRWSSNAPWWLIWTLRVNASMVSSTVGHQPTMKRIVWR